MNFTTRIFIGLLFFYSKLFCTWCKDDFIRTNLNVDLDLNLDKTSVVVKILQFYYLPISRAYRPLNTGLGISGPCMGLSDKKDTSREIPATYSNQSVSYTLKQHE